MKTPCRNCGRLISTSARARWAHENGSQCQGPLCERAIACLQALANLGGQADSRAMEAEARRLDPGGWLISDFYCITDDLVFNRGLIAYRSKTAKSHRITEKGRAVLLADVEGRIQGRERLAGKDGGDG